MRAASAIQNKKAFPESAGAFQSSARFDRMPSGPGPVNRYGSATVRPTRNHFPGATSHENPNRTFIKAIVSSVMSGGNPVIRKTSAKISIKGRAATNARMRVGIKGPMPLGKDAAPESLLEEWDDGWGDFLNERPRPVIYAMTAGHGCRKLQA